LSKGNQRTLEIFPNLKYLKTYALVLICLPISKFKKSDFLKAISRKEYTKNRCLSLSKAVIAVAFDKLRQWYNFSWKAPKKSDLKFLSSIKYVQKPRVVEEAFV
jgi:hypothetical protein